MIDKLIIKLESLYLPGFVPGTVLQRTLLPIRGHGWVVGAGYLQRPLQFFYGPTPEAALRKAIRGFRNA